MARDFGPFPSKPMYEVVNRRMQKALAEATASTGFAKSGQGAVTAGTGAQLVIAAYPDGALVDGLWVENPDPEPVTLTTNSGSTNPRIDRLVMRLDMAAETIAPFQIVGTPGANPQVPPLVQTATVFDMPLVRYTMPGSASAQNPGSIVDERSVLGGAEAWQAYTPTFASAGGAPTVGNGTLIGKYRRHGRMCAVRIYFSFGSTSNAGTGQMHFALPFPAVSDGSEQTLTAKAFTSNGKNWGGIGLIPPGSSVVDPYLPLGSTPDLGPAQGANTAGTAGTGIPLVSGDFTFKAGSNLVIQGTYEAA